MSEAGEPFDRTRQRPHEGRDEGGERGPSVVFLPGQLVATRFRIEQLAGRGGMGTVYRALDLTTGSHVAIKCVERTFRTSGERFAREATMLAQLSHPAIVRYVAHGFTERDVPFLAMEWLEGEDLAVRLQRSGLPVAETLSLVRRACEGLGAAHARGLVHRDLKPSNLFLVGGRAEGLKLLDFGVARQLQRSAAETLTRAGAVIGTVGYMAPEQAMGRREVDGRADLFALGCVMFECLTGLPAFFGAHDVAVLSKVLCEEAPRVRSVRPELSEALDELVARLLAKEPADRPDDVHAVLAALDQLGTTHEGGAPEARRPSSPHLVVSEQRIASVLVARPLAPASATLTSADAEASDAQFDALLQRFGGEPVPLHKGQFLIAFGSGPGMVASDQAVQAVRCALELSRVRPGLQVAVATGGLQQTLNASVGAAIDRAVALLDARLAQQNRVMIDPLTAGLLNARFRLQRTDSGVSVVAESDEVERPRLLLGRPSPCVGREKELGLLEATLAEAMRDEIARVLLVTAEPGMGKSRLAREFLERVHEKPVRTLFARAEPMARGSAWSLVQRLLSRVLGLHESDPPALRRQRLRDRLREHVDAPTLAWLSDFLGELIGAHPPRDNSPLLRAARDDPSVMREQTRRAIQRWFLVELAQRPLLIVLEDLHWGDLPSVGLLEECLQTMADRPLFLLAFARPDVHEHFPGLWRSVGCQEYVLQGLTPRAAERLVRDALPAHVDRNVVTRIVELAQGNAFYLEELLRHVAQGGEELPETVRAMAQSRLERLSQDARRLMRAASVFGQASWVSGVAALLGAGANAADEFQQLAREEIFVQRTQSRFPSEREYAFRHALLRDAAYAMITDSDRRRAHGLAGEWLQKAGERDPCVLAEHFEQSDEPERAIPWLLRAGSAALASGDLSGAVLLARRGLRLGAEGRDRADLLLLQAHASAWGTRTNLQLAEEALRLFPAGSSSWWFSLSLLVFGASATGRANLAEPYLELAQHTPPPAEERLGMYGQAFEVLALGAALLGRADIGWSLLDKLQAIVQRMPSGDTLSRAWLHVAQCQLATNSLRDGSWQLEHALTAGREAVSGMREVSAVHGEGTAHLHLGITLLELGCYDQAEQAFTDSREQALRAGNVLIAEFSRLMLVVFALRRGRTAEGLAMLDALAHSSDANVVQGATSVRAEVYLRSGKLEEALTLASSVVSGPGLMYRLAGSLTLARVLRARGEHERALSAIEIAIQLRGDSSFPQFEIELESMRAELASELGHHDIAGWSARKALHVAELRKNAIASPELRASFTRKLRLSPRLPELARRPPG